MKKFNPPLSSYSTDDLIFILELHGDLWQQDFLEAAKQELASRGLSQEEILKHSSRIEKNQEEYEAKEQKIRAQMAYTPLQATWRVLFWNKYLLRDWGLKKEGYATLAKQRVQYLLTGILLYAVVMLLVFSAANNHQDEREEKIAAAMKMDSIYESQINWSGLFQFDDANEEGRTIWKLQLEKLDKTLHSGTLEINRSGESKTYEVEASCSDTTVQVFPATEATIEPFGKCTKYDLLFEFVVEQQDTLTWWDKLAPLNAKGSNGAVCYRRLR